jgi:hypothetical protein
LRATLEEQFEEFYNDTRIYLILPLNQSPEADVQRKLVIEMIEPFYELQTTIQKLPFMLLQLQASLVYNSVEIQFEKFSKLLVKQNASLVRSYSSNLSTNTGGESGVEKKKKGKETGIRCVGLMRLHSM